jgi:Family of unknown function (DUF6390)
VRTPKSSTPRSKYSGELLHAKHAFPPNNLGYCGPDVRGKIQEYLHSQSDSEDVRPILTRFEAAYPFVRMIAKSTGRKPFDYEVAEAYWLGNDLLDKVQTREFFEFAHQSLSPTRKKAGKNNGAGKQEAKAVFRKLGSMARPHHTFYVLGLYARTSEMPETGPKLIELMDSCRISWGKVLEVKRESLIVERPSLVMKQGNLSLSSPQKKEVQYDPEIPPFSGIKRGDWVSLHWNFASEKLVQHQLRNLKRYTALDIAATNNLVSQKS